jgi:hypothetical protein
MRTPRAALGIVLLACLLPAVGARAGEESRRPSLFRPWPREGRMRASARVLYSTEEEVQTQDADFGVLEYDLSFSMALFASDESELVFTLRYDSLDIDTDAVLPRNPDDDFPDSLTDLSFTFDYQVDLDVDVDAGLNCRISSTSDELFGDEATLLSLTGYLRVPDWAEGNSWLFYVNWATRRTEHDVAPYYTSSELDRIPLPGFAYQMVIDEANWGLLGFPYSAVHVEPDEWLVIDVSYQFMRKAHAKLTFPVSDRLEFYGAFDWVGRVFYRSDREYDDERLVLYDKKVRLGVSYKTQNNMSFVLEVGRSFDRFVYEEENYGERKNDWFEIEDAKFINFQFRVSF